MWFELRTPGLQHVAPDRAAARRALRQDALARTATFPVYGVAAWEGRRLPVRWAADGDHWVALVPLEGLHLSVRAHRVPLDAAWSL